MENKKNINANISLLIFCVTLIIIIGLFTLCQIKLRENNNVTLEHATECNQLVKEAGIHCHDDIGCSIKELEEHAFDLYHRCIFRLPYNCDRIKKYEIGY